MGDHPQALLPHLAGGTRPDIAPAAGRVLPLRNAPRWGRAPIAGSRLMTDRDAFLRAICDRPDDDTPRLVFADWLEEHGESKRAEFIRTQVEMGQAEEFGPRWRVLDKLQRKLPEVTRASWSQGLDGLGVLNVKFRRGFPDEVTVYSKRFVAEYEELFTAAPIRRVKFASLTAAQGNVPLAELLRCPALARLRGLDLANTPLTEEAVEQLAGCEHLRGLRELTLSAEGLTPDAGRTLIRSKNLEGLTDLAFVGQLEADVYGNGLVAALAGEPGFRRIARLSVRSAGLGPAGAEALAASPHAAGLRFLAVSGLGLSAIARLGLKGAAALAGSPHL